MKQIFSLSFCIEDKVDSFLIVLQYNGFHLHFTTAIDVYYDTFYVLTVVRMKYVRLTKLPTAYSSLERYNEDSLRRRQRRGVANYDGDSSLVNTIIITA